MLYVAIVLTLFLRPAKSTKSPADASTAARRRPRFLTRSPRPPIRTRAPSRARTRRTLVPHAPVASSAPVARRLRTRRRPGPHRAARRSPRAPAPPRPRRGPAARSRCAPATPAARSRPPRPRPATSPSPSRTRARRSPSSTSTARATGSSARSRTSAPALTRQLLVEVPQGGAVHDRLQAGHGRRRHPRAVHRDRQRRRAPPSRRRRARRRGRRLPALHELADRGARDAKTQEFIDAVKRGDVPAAQALFPVSRTYWERIEPVAESFGDIDPRIDGREDDERDPGVAVHRLPPPREGPVGHRPAARLERHGRRRCMADIRELQTRAATVQLTPRAAGQRRQGAARRGRHRQDHRRGGPLLAHRPVGLPRQRRRLAGRDRRAAPGARPARPGAGPGARRSASPTSTGSSSSTARATGSCSTPS